MTKNSAEVIIIGGGVIGAACAYYLSLRGVKVLVLERNHMCAGASGATAAIIFGNGNSPTADPLQRLNFESHLLIGDIEEDFDTSMEKISGGSLYAAMNEGEARELQLLYNHNQRSGNECQYFSGSDVQQFEPLLGPQVLAALHEPGDFHVNPYRFCQGYLGAAMRRGGRVEYGITVRDVKVKNQRIESVVTDKGDYHADKVVVAAGAWTPDVLKSINVNIPINPARGQVIITEACELLTERLIMFFDHLYIKQTASGNFYLGSHSEYVGFENRITFEKIATYAQFYLNAIPLFTKLRALRFFAGFRPLSADEIPIIGQIPGYPELIIATGHGRSGMCFSAATGKSVSELVVDGKSALPLGAFSVERFSEKGL